MKTVTQLLGQQREIEEADSVAMAEPQAGSIDARDHHILKHTSIERVDFWQELEIGPRGRRIRRVFHVRVERRRLCHRPGQRRRLRAIARAGLKEPGQRVAGQVGKLQKGRPAFELNIEPGPLNPSNDHIVKSRTRERRDIASKTERCQNK